MLWGGVSYYGLSTLSILEGNQNARGYCGVLEEGLLDFADKSSVKTRRLPMIMRLFIPQLHKIMFAVVEC